MFNLIKGLMCKFARRIIPVRVIISGLLLRLEDVAIFEYRLKCGGEHLSKKGPIPPNPYGPRHSLQWEELILGQKRSMNQFII